MPEPAKKFGIADAVRRDEAPRRRPADHLREAIDGVDEAGATVKIVRRGVAQVTAGGSKACLKLPRTTDGEPTVAKGAC